MLKTDDNHSATNSPDIITISTGSFVLKLCACKLFFFWPTLIMNVLTVTPQSRALLIPQLVNSPFMEHRGSLPYSQEPNNWIVSCANWTQSTHHIYTWILNGFFASGFLTKMLYTISPSKKIQGQRLWKWGPWEEQLDTSWLRSKVLQKTLGYLVLTQKLWNATKADCNMLAEWRAEFPTSYYITAPQEE